MATVDEILAEIVERLEEIELERGLLEGARLWLVGDASPARPTNGDTAKHATTKSEANAVFEALLNGNQQATKIAKALNMQPAHVRRELEELARRKWVKRVGERAGTRWIPESTAP